MKENISHYKSSEDSASEQDEGLNGTFKLSCMGKGCLQCDRGIAINILGVGKADCTCVFGNLHFLLLNTQRGHLP